MLSAYASVGATLGVCLVLLTRFLSRRSQQPEKTARQWAILFLFLSLGFAAAAAVKVPGPRTSRHAPPLYSYPGISALVAAGLNCLVAFWRRPPAAPGSLEEMGVHRK